MRLFLGLLLAGLVVLAQETGADADPALDTPARRDTTDAPDVSPFSIEGVTRVDAEGLINTASDLDDLIIIDARIPSDRREGYIEGSISLPDKDTDCESLSRIVPDTHWPILFYCNGPKCGRSAKSSRIAVNCGYDNIFWYRGGIEDWKIKQYPLQY